MIRGYGSGDSEEEEEFYGFDQHDGSQEYADRFAEMAKDFTVRHFRQGLNAEVKMDLTTVDCWSGNNPVAVVVNLIDDDFLDTMNLGGDAQISEDDYDLEEEVTKKRTKKEFRKLYVTKKRRLKHIVITEVCGCDKNCSELLLRDDRTQINERFWKMNLNGQRDFIRRYISLERVANRRRTA